MDQDQYARLVSEVNTNHQLLYCVLALIIVSIIIKLTMAIILYRASEAGLRMLHEISDTNQIIKEYAIMSKDRTKHTLQTMRDVKEETTKTREEATRTKELIVASPLPMGVEL